MNKRREKNQKMKRSTGIDLIKTIAIFSIVMIHVSAQYLVVYGAVGTWQFDASVVWRCLCGAGVPLFLMCSGALMLRPEKELTVKRLYSHNILRLVIAMLVWAMAYKLWWLYFGGALNAANIVNAFKEVLLFNQEFHLYYIHIMLLVYFFLPVTRSFVKNATEKEMRYFLLVWFLFGILYPTVKPYWPFNLVGDIPSQWSMVMSYSAIGYGVLGYYINRNRFSVKTGMLLAVIGYAAVLLPTLLVTRANGVLFQGCLDGMTFGMCLLSAGIFILCLHAGEGLKKGKGFVAYMSRASFCIYLCHMFVMYTLQNLGAFTVVTPAVSIPLLTAATVAVGTAVYWVISHIPVLNRWIV
jgi:surface polysaccharide O-acyltransferase-like enzyme